MRPVTFWTQSWKHLRETHDSVNKVTFVLLQRFDGLLAVARRLLNDEVNVLRVEASLVDRAVLVLHFTKYNVNVRNRRLVYVRIVNDVHVTTRTAQHNALDSCQLLQANVLKRPC